MFMKHRLNIDFVRFDTKANSISFVTMLNLMLFLIEPVKSFSFNQYYSG